MQKDRHDADYDPDATFFKSQVIANIAAADVAIRLFNRAPRKDRRAFAVYVLLTTILKGDMTFRRQVRRRERGQGEAGVDGPTDRIADHTA